MQHTLYNGYKVVKFVRSFIYIYMYIYVCDYSLLYITFATFIMNSFACQKHTEYLKYVSCLNYQVCRKKALWITRGRVLASHSICSI
jgi:hypothetical protein